MTSRQDEEAGPSGLAHEDTLRLLGLETSDSEKEDMGDSEEDDLCNDLMDR